MFTDPISITVNGVTKSMARISTGTMSSVYSTSDGLFTLTLSHQETGKQRVRTLVKFVQKAIVTNPLDSTNDYDTMTLSLTIDRPMAGFTIVQLEQLTAGFISWLTNANVDKLYGKES